MFNFLQSDNKPFFDVVGTSIISCSYSCRIRDDLRLLLSLGFDTNSVVKKITDYYPIEIKNILTDYEYKYYYPLTYIALAYYLAKDGYYHKETFDTAIKFIDNESTLFVWRDAVKLERAGYNPIGDILLDTFGNKADELAESVIGEPLPLGIKLKKSNTPDILNQILFLDGKAEKKVEKRKNELLKVKDLLLSENFTPKKRSASSVLYKISDYKFTTPFCEGDVISYKIKSGINKGKYALFVVDYIREMRNILCDSEHYVEKWEYFALIDGLFDKIPTKIPCLYISTGELIDCYDNKIAFNHFYCTENQFEFAKFGFEKIGKTECPKLQKSAIIKSTFTPREEALAEPLYQNDIDFKLENIFK